MIRKAAPDEPITDFAPQDTKILTAVRNIGGSETLLAKFARRKNINRGCIARMPCLFGEAEAMARVLFPVHPIWSQLAARIPTGGPLFRSMEFSFNRHLRANLALAGISQSNKSPHTFSGVGTPRNCKSQATRMRR